MNGFIVNRSDFVDSDTVEGKIESFSADIGYPNEFSASFKAVKVSEEKIYVSADVGGYFLQECSRCTVSYKNKINIKINTELDFSGQTADIGEEIRQILILEIPMKPLCSKACAGISESCDKDASSDDFTKEKWRRAFEKK